MSLRDYQARAVEQIEKAVNVLYVLPTGGGKTVVATSVPVSLKEAKAGLLELANQAESWKFPHAANAHDRSRGRAKAD